MGGQEKMIDTQSYLNTKEDTHWSKRLSPPTSLKVDQLVAAGLQHPGSLQITVNPNIFFKLLNVTIDLATETTLKVKITVCISSKKEK